MTQEEKRLQESRERKVHWKRWGPYLSERAWGTVREDYSPDGNAWDYLPHDQARSKAYRWNEDGLAGISDRHQYVCFAVALWNERDSILKERLFGLTGTEGTHGEDVKEYYFYLDSTPTHSYMKFLYKYPQAPFPYLQLVENSRLRDRRSLEYELIDTGVFDEDRYFDVLVEYAKGGVEDILIRISVVNRGPDPAPLHLLPTLWFRNTWECNGGTPAANLRRAEGVRLTAVELNHHVLGQRHLYCEGTPDLLFTE
ncbi:MAG TPA: glucosidase, partial [Terriglobia bacterium]|nr:glucosidase [Terriglobia bacterium]